MFLQIKFFIGKPCVTQYGPAPEKCLESSNLGEKIKMKDRGILTEIIQFPAGKGIEVFHLVQNAFQVFGHLHFSFIRFTAEKNNRISFQMKQLIKGNLKMVANQFYLFQCDELFSAQPAVYTVVT